MGNRLSNTNVLKVLVVSLGLISSSMAQQSDRWKPHPSVGVLNRVIVRIHWHETSAELREAARNSGQNIIARGIHGFSILRRNTQTGDYVCDLFVLKMAGAWVDNDRTKTFGHEVLHCIGLSHK